MCNNRHEFGIEIFYDEEIGIRYFQQRLSEVQKESDEVKSYFTLRIILYFNASISNIKIICRDFLFELILKNSHGMLRLLRQEERRCKNYQERIKYCKEMGKYVIKYVHSISRISEGLRAYQYSFNKFNIF